MALQEKNTSGIQNLFILFIIRMYSTESKQNFAKHSDLSVKITDPKRHLNHDWRCETLLENLQQLSIKIFLEKLRQVPVTGSQSKI